MQQIIRKYVTIDIWIISTIFICALSIRFVYLFQLVNTPFFIPSPYNLDLHLFHTWAIDIAQGNWIGQDVFVGMPLYPYVLGVIYACSNASVYSAKIIQMVLGSLSVVCIYGIGAHYFDKKVGILAACGAIAYGLFMFYEGFLLSTSLEVFLGCLLILALGKVYGRPSAIKWLCIGIISGLCSLSRASFLLFALCIFVAIPFVMQEYIIRKKIVWAGLFLLGLVISIVPVTIRNYIVTNEFMLITAHGGINFYIGNNPTSQGTFDPPAAGIANSRDLMRTMRLTAERELGTPITLNEASQHWYKKSLDYICTQPVSWMKLLGRKFLLFVNGLEIPDVASPVFMKRFVPLLAWPWLSWRVIGPCALLGMIIGLHLWRKLFFLYIFVLSYSLSIILFFVNSRYRLPVVPVFIVFAAYAFYTIVHMVKDKEYNRLITSSIILILFIVMVNLSLTWHDMAPAHNNLGLIYKSKGWYHKAIDEFKKAIAINPRQVAVYLNMGNVYVRLRDFMAAIDMYKQGIAINPHIAKLHEQLGVAYAAQGLFDNAQEAWREALALDPSNKIIKANLKRISRINK